MTNRVLCGIHALKENKREAYFPVGVYFSLSNKLTHRETGLAQSTEEPSLGHCLDTITQCIDSYSLGEGRLAGQEHTQEHLDSHGVVLDPLVVSFPSREKIGKKEKGKVVGWHIDLKTNAKRKNVPPCLITNLAWMNEKGEVSFTVVDKKSFFPRKEDDIIDTMHCLFFAASEAYPLGSSICMEVIPQGKKLARYVITEYNSVNTMTETICQALKAVL